MLQRRPLALCFSFSSCLFPPWIFGRRRGGDRRRAGGGVLFLSRCFRFWSFFCGWFSGVFIYRVLCLQCILQDQPRLPAQEQFGLQSPQLTSKPGPAVHSKAGQRKTQSMTSQLWLPNASYLHCYKLDLCPPEEQEPLQVPSNQRCRSNSPFSAPLEHIPVSTDARSGKPLMGTFKGYVTLQDGDKDTQLPQTCDFLRVHLPNPLKHSFLDIVRRWQGHWD